MNITVKRQPNADKPVEFFEAFVLNDKTFEKLGAYGTTENEAVMNLTNSKLFKEWSDTGEIDSDVAVVPVFKENLDDSCKVKDDYGWEIDPQKAWDAFEELKEEMGESSLLQNIALALGDIQLADILAYICRNHEIEIPQLKSDTKDSVKDGVIEEKENADKLAKLDRLKNKTVKVVKGRKVPVGTTGKLFWSRIDSRGYVGSGVDPYKVIIRIGIKDNEGNVYWTYIENVEEVTE